MTPTAKRFWICVLLWTISGICLVYSTAVVLLWVLSAVAHFILFIATLVLASKLVKEIEKEEKRDSK